MSEGLFDDTAVIRRVVREGILLAGAGNAVLLQLANPGVGLGVHEHSDFAYRPGDRLRTTMTYVYSVAFGTKEEAERVSRIVHSIHKKVTGPTYSANDPELQVWVAGTLYHTAAQLYQQFFGDLTEAELDELYLQYGAMATSIGTPADMWPENRKAFEAYWNFMINTLQVNDAAREVARQLLYPEHTPFMMRPLVWLSRKNTFGLLPEPIRAQYGFSWDARRQKRLDRFMRVLALVYTRLPMSLREKPKNYYLEDMRRRMNKSGRRVPAAL